MPILYAEIQVAGLSAVCAVASYSFAQATDYAGRPSSTVHVGLLRVVLTGEEAVWPVWETLMFDPYRRESGHLVFFEEEGKTAKQVTFYNAACVHYECRFDARGQEGKASFETELHFSAATAEVQGQRLEAHSLIPWATDAATSFRALTKPPEPLPSAALSALLRSGTLQAETLASGLLKRVITPGGELATEFLGVGLTAIARAASLTAGLVLTPANNPNAPGYDAEKNFSRDHPILPPDPDAFRLAQLEAEREHRALTVDEHAEYVALLAKVKGIHAVTVDDAAYNQQWAHTAPPELAHLDLEATLNHVEYRDYSVPRGNGIGGAHNAAEFAKHKVDYKETSRTPHTTVPGVELVGYQIYALNRELQPTGQVKAKIYPKSVYDPQVWPRPRLERALKESLLDAYKNNGSKLPLPREWTGQTKEGYRIRGFYDPQANKITTFFFESSKD